MTSADPFANNCPTVADLTALLDGEMRENAALATRQHLSCCATCRARAERLETAASWLSPAIPAKRDDAFVGQVMQRIAQDDRSSATDTSRTRTWWGMGSLAIAAGVALAVLPTVSGEQGSLGTPGLTAQSSVPDGPSANPGEFQARGGHAGTSPVQTKRFNVALFAGPESNEPLASGAQTDLSRGLRFAVTNPGPAGYLMLLGVDARSDVHWFFPAWTDPASDPASVPLPSHQIPTLLPQGVTPNSPASGSFEVVAVFTSQPLTVRAVEKMIAKHGLDGLENALKSKDPSGQIRRLPLENPASP